MIFVTVGTQKFQFDRLLKYIDKQIEDGRIKDKVFAQIGHSSYEPKNYKYKKFLDKEEFEKYVDNCTLVITHSGVGTIISTINKNKPIIVVPRLKKYKEHVDDHQVEIANSFAKKNFVISNGENISDLLSNIDRAKKFCFSKYQSSNEKIQNTIMNYIEENDRKNNRKIKVVYVVKSLAVNGISNVILNYCEHINKKQFDITIIAGSPIANQNLKKAKKIGVKVIESPPKRGKNPLKYYYFMYKGLRSKKYDIIHIHGNSATVALELLIAKINGIKIRVAHSHNITCDKKIAHKLLKPLLISDCTYRVACGEEAGKWMFGSKKFDVLPNGFVTENFIYNENNRDKIRKKLKIKENQIVIGHVGMFNDQKNHPFLLDVFNEICKKNDNYKLLLVGNGPDLENILKMIDNHPYKNNIIYYGVTDNVSEVYDAMDLFVLPSKYEGLVIVLLEAQIKGLKCITSDAVPKEVTLNKNNIKFLPLKDGSEKWAEKVLKTTIENKRSEYYDKNMKNIRKYNIKANAKALEDKYKDMFLNL